MTLSQRLSALYSDIQNYLVQCKDALEEKGVTVSDTLHLKDLADKILLVEQTTGIEEVERVVDRLVYTTGLSIDVDTMIDFTSHEDVESLINYTFSYSDVLGSISGIDNSFIVVQNNTAIAFTNDQIGVLAYEDFGW